MINYEHKHRRRGGLSNKKNNTFIVGDIQAKKFIQHGLKCERRGQYQSAIDNYKNAMQSAIDYKLVQFAEKRKDLCGNKIRSELK